MWKSRSNFVRHIGGCREIRKDGSGEAGPVGDCRDEGGVERGRRTRGRVAMCQLCGRTLSCTNVARHQRPRRWAKHLTGVHCAKWNAMGKKGENKKKKKKKELVTLQEHALLWFFYTLGMRKSIKKITKLNNVFLYQI